MLAKGGRKGMGKAMVKKWMRDASAKDRTVTKRPNGVEEE
jgi:hypothetical protein